MSQTEFLKLAMRKKELKIVFTIFVELSKFVSLVGTELVIATASMLADEGGINEWPKRSCFCIYFKLGVLSKNEVLTHNARIFDFLGIYFHM